MSVDPDDPPESAATFWSKIALLSGISIPVIPFIGVGSMGALGLAMILFAGAVLVLLVALVATFVRQPTTTADAATAIGGLAVAILGTAVALWQMA